MTLPTSKGHPGLQEAPFRGPSGVDVDEGTGRLFVPGLFPSNSFFVSGGLLIGLFVWGSGGAFLFGHEPSECTRTFLRGGSYFARSQDTGVGHNYRYQHTDHRYYSIIAAVKRRHRALPKSYFLAF